MKFKYYLFLSLSEKPDVSSRAPYKFAFKEGDVEYRGIVVHELQQVYFQRERIVKLSLRAEKLLFRQPLR